MSVELEDPIAVAMVADEAKCKTAMICPFCRVSIDFIDFKDELSRREYAISGLCQKCQDDFFFRFSVDPDGDLD